MTDKISFKLYTRDNWEEALKMEVFPEQKKFAPTIAESLATAYIKPWDEAFDPYLIYIDEIMIGAFYLSYTPDSKDNYWLGGFMIDKNYQNKGYGRRALPDILKFISSLHKKCQEIKLTVEQDNIVAQKLYKSLGFGDTGEKNKYGEIIYTLPVTGKSD